MIPEATGPIETANGSAGPRMLRTSSYTIYVELPGNREDMLLVHGYTGAFDKVSRNTAAFVRSLQAKPPKPEGQEWKPADETVEVLKRRGHLTEKTAEEEEAFFAALVTRLHALRQRAHPSYMFMPTYNCNLRCPYCFQDYMRTDPGFGHLLKLMQPEMVDRIFSAIPGIESSHGYPEGIPLRNITFFGGEPLLEASRPAVERIVDSALRLGPARLSAITNGTDLHAYKGLLSPEKISSLQITIDGPPSEHDQRRVYADGSGSYERILRNIRFALDEGVVVGARVNIDRNNIATLPAMIDDIESRGLTKYPNFTVYASPIRAENPQTDARTTFDVWQLSRALAALGRQHPRMSLVHPPDGRLTRDARRVFNGEGLPSFRESFCSSHSGLYIFDPFGDIYVCWDRTGDTENRFGHIEDDGLISINEPVRDLWRSRTVATNPVCLKCRYALYCGGGCAVLAHGKTGNYHSSFCDGFASRFRSHVAEAFLQRDVDAGTSASADVACG